MGLRARHSDNGNKLTRRELIDMDECLNEIPDSNDNTTDTDKKCFLCSATLKKGIHRLDGFRGYDCEFCGDYVIPEKLYLASCNLGSGDKACIPYDLEIVKQAMLNYLKSDAYDKRKSDDGKHWIISTWFFWGETRKEEFKNGRNYVQLDKLCENIKLKSSKAD